MAKLITSQSIDIENPASDFLEHLTLNNRILFSGKFGVGKTFFLRHFFETQEKYNVFHLFPINYQIATNEDIFELIKYDILYHLFDFEWIKIDNKKFSNTLAFQFYFMNNSVNIISKIFQCLSELKNAGKIMETLNGIYNDALKYKDDINKNDATLLTAFYEQLKKKKGSVHEFDAISELICDNLANCNNEIAEDKHKKNILIIDDLDRIDPEHIFRLLNVFSAHMDMDKDTNKFGFDKIIFVCDVENIRTIFSAKYGQFTDFNGYINKFYSTEVFHFDNKAAIFKFVSEIMRTKVTNFTQEEFDFMKIILGSLVMGGGINLRQIFANVQDWRDKKQNVGVIGGYYFSGHTIIWTCLKILGGQKETLIDSLKKAVLPKNYATEEWQEILSLVLPLVPNHIFSSFENSYTRMIGDVTITFRIDNNRHGRESVRAIITSPIIIDFFQFKNILIEVVEILDKKGLLN